MDFVPDRILAGLVLSSSPTPNQHHSQSPSSSSSDSMTVTTSSIHTGTSVNNSQFDQIDQEIIRYEDAVRDLKSRRNLLAPISKLPAEILCTVFMFCSLTEPPTPSSYTSEIRWRWIIVTHISRLWRTIALSCPPLWSKPEFNKTEWAYEMLKRSKMAPLTIEVSPNYWITPRVVEAVSEGLKHLPRINEIHLSASRDNMDKLLSGITNPAPFLKTLFLDIGRSDYYYHTRGEPYILPENFLGGEAPHLTHIDLTRCHLRWDSTLLCNLTFLKVHNSGPPAPTLDQFLSALAGMPLLEVLDLENTLPANSDTGGDKTQVSLPRLRKLHTTCSLSESAIFFEHVHVPSSASLHVVAKCSDLLEIGSDTLELINQVCQKLPVVRDTTARLSNGVPTIKTLLVQSHGIGSGIIVEAWNNIPSSNRSTQFLREPATLPYTLNSLAYAPSSVGWLRLEFTWQNHDVIRQLHNQVVVAICNPLPLTQLRNLHVRNGYHDNVSSPAFAKTFGTLPKVNSLTVEGNSAYEFVDALNQQTGLERASPAPSSSSSTSPRPTLAFPALRTLKLLDVDFDRERETANTLLHPLMDCLMQRYELKSEIYKLILERCTHLTGDDVVELEEIVTDVEWDGLEDGYTDTEDEEMDEDEYDDDMDVFGGEAYYGYGGAYSSDEDMMFLGF